MNGSTSFNYPHNGERCEVRFTQINSLDPQHLASLLKHASLTLDRYTLDLKADSSNRSKALVSWASAWCDAASLALFKNHPVESAHQRALDLLSILNACSSQLDDIEHRIDSAHSRLHQLSLLLDHLPIHSLSSSIV